MRLVSESQSVDIERYYEWNKSKVLSNRGSINQFLRLRYSNFPAELVKGRQLKNPLKYGNGICEKTCYILGFQTHPMVK